MASLGSALSKPALLCVAPPYNIGPPAGLAYLLAYAREQGCSDFGFLDLRLGVPDAYAPTYSHTGVFGESYVMDVPDLPLVLALARAVDEREEPTARLPLVLPDYCRDRGISASYLRDYLACLDRYFAAVAASLAGVRFVGCSVWTSNLLTTLLFAAHLKRLARPPIVVAGGPQVTESFASAGIGLRSRLFDAVVLGEGEASLLDLYSRVSATGRVPATPLPGTLVLGGEDEILRGEPRPLLRHHEIPFPAFDQMPLLSYQQAGTLRSVPYHLSRGCTDKCVFCSEWKFWQRFRLGESARAVEGAKALRRAYGAEHLAFTDSLLNGHPGRLREFAEGMARLSPRMAWGGFMRAQMDPETAALLRRAGCDTVFLGIESMSDETLALMNKRRTEAENIQALRAFLGAGIHVVAGLIPGFPGDGRANFFHTVEKLRSLQREYPGKLRANVEPFIVSPGQPLYTRLSDIGLRGEPWSDEAQDVAPRYRDLTERVFATVVGDNQGMERLGRLRMAEAMESDAPTRTDFFYYKVAEDLARTEIDFRNLVAGWCIARVKGPDAWTYALIVDEAEREELERKTAGNAWLDVLAARGLQRTLRRIEAAHLVKPARGPRLQEGGYAASRGEDTSYQVSPYVVARYGDWHVRNRLLVSDFATASWSLLPAWQGEALAALHRAPHTAASLARHLAKKGIARPTERLLADLSESGVLLAIEPRTSAERRALAS